MPRASLRNASCLGPILVTTPKIASVRFRRGAERPGQARSLAERIASKAHALIPTGYSQAHWPSSFLQ